VTSVSDGPGPRYGFGFAGSSDGNVYLLGGFAPSKNDTGSWVQLKGGFSQLDHSTRVQDLANDDLWLFNSTSVGWTLLTDSVYSAICGENADPYATLYFCKDYAGLSRVALVRHDFDSDSPVSRLYIIGGSWYLPRIEASWASYDIANRSWSLLLSDIPSGLKWVDIGDKRPTGTEVSNENLATELRAGKREFTQVAWDAFNVTPPITDDTFITVTNNSGQVRYFMPDRYSGPMIRDAARMQKSPAAVSNTVGNIFLLSQVRSEKGESQWDTLKYHNRHDLYRWTDTTAGEIDVSKIGATLFFGATNCSDDLSNGLCLFGGGMDDGAGRWRERYGREFEDLDGIPELIYYKDQKWKMNKIGSPVFGYQGKIRNRYGHNMVSTDRQMYIFGGTYGNIDNTHHTPDTFSPNPHNLENRMSVKDPTAAFENSIENANMGIRTALNDLWECNVAQKDCKKITSATAPPGRSFFGFTAICASSNWTLVLFGGMGTARDTEFSDTWKFDVTSWQWSNFSSNKNPSGRVGLVLTSGDDDKVYLFGGGRFNWNKIEQSEESLVWNTVEPSADCFWVLNTKTWQWIQQTPKGPTPSPRAFAGFAWSGKDLYLFAGLGREKKVLSDLWTYSLTFSTWTPLAVEVPSNRFGMQLIALTSALNTDIFVVGGETSGEIKIYKLPVPKTVSAPADALDWLRIYDLDTVDLKLASPVWKNLLNGAQQSITLCQGLYPCAMRLHGKPRRMGRFPYNFKCSGLYGCTDLQVTDLNVECTNFALEAPMFEVLAGGKMEIRNSAFKNCTYFSDKTNLTIGEGAIIRASQNSFITVKESLFYNCSSQGNGGAMSFYGSSLQVSNSRFVQCTSFKGSGGGVWSNEYVSWPETPMRSNIAATSTNFTKCKAQKKGGAISATFSSLELLKCRFEENSAANSGGGMELQESNGIVAGTQFINNKAESIGGGALQLLNSGVELFANTFDANSAPQGGGGALLWAGKPAPILRMACDLGRFAGEKDTDGNPTCVPCAPGSFRDSFTTATCRLCEIGKYIPNSGASACQQCERGKFQHAKGATACYECGANADSDAGRSSLDQCFCVAGSYGLPSSSGCRSCTSNADSLARSTYVSQCFCKANFYGDGATRCDKCPRDSKSPARSARVGACSCNAGFTGDPSTGDPDACAACPTGKYAGTVVNRTGIQCVSCPKGSFSNSTGASACTECPAGKFRATIGGTSETNCSSCISNADSPAGSTRKGDCTCKASYYGNDAKCNKCPENSVSSAGSKNKTDCSCNAGFYSEDITSNCKPCPKGEFSAISSINCTGGCGCNNAISTVASGTLSDGPGNYKDHEYCEWEITANPGNIITLSFDANFDTEENFDVVTISQKCPGSRPSSKDGYSQDGNASAVQCNTKEPCGVGQFCEFESKNGGSCKPCNVCSGECGSCGLSADGITDCFRACEADTGAQDEYGCKFTHKLSGNNIVAEDLVYTSRTGFLKIHFLSDGSVDRDGFTATWTVTGDTKCVACPAGTYAADSGASTCIDCPFGKISPQKSESAQACERFQEVDLQEFDWNSNGCVSKPEFVGSGRSEKEFQFLSQGGECIILTTMEYEEPLFEVIDTNGNDCITEEEFGQHALAWWSPFADFASRDGIPDCISRQDYSNFGDEEYSYGYADGWYSYGYADGGYSYGYGDDEYSYGNGDGGSSYGYADGGYSYGYGDGGYRRGVATPRSTDTAIVGYSSPSPSPSPGYGDGGSLGGRRLRRLISGPDSAVPSPVPLASEKTLRMHELWLCNRGLPKPNLEPNTAVYGSCVATLFDNLQITGLPSEKSPGYAGVNLDLEVQKKDTYGQIILSDSNSFIQLYSALNGARTTDMSIIIEGSVYSGFVQGRAQLKISVKPSFSELNMSTKYTALLLRPYLYVAGADAFSDNEGAVMQSEVMQMHIAQGYQQVCPTGYVLSLTNGLNNPGGCIKCKAGSYSLSPLAGPPPEDCPPNTEIKDKKCPATEPGCFKCPVGAICLAGGADVTAQESWWLVEEEVEDSSASRREEANLNKVFQPYKCPDPETCLTKNDCANNRTGVACGKCREHYARQAGTCIPCPVRPWKEVVMWRWIFSIVVAVILVFVWFLLCWAPLFGMTAKGYIELWFGGLIRKVKGLMKLKQNAEKVAGDTAKAKERLADMSSKISDMDNMQFVQQYAKILIGYFQVVGSFVTFKVVWPFFLGSCIAFLSDVADLLKIDLLELPNLSCTWLSVSYEHKTYFKLIFPLVVIVFMSIPVAVSLLQCNCTKKKQNQCPNLEEDGRSDAKAAAALARQRYEKVLDCFWNNLMFWLFIIYPGASRASLEPFVCMKIYKTNYLIASWEDCPWGGGSLRTWKPLAGIALLFIFIYPIGVPVLMYLFMRYNGVPEMAKKKIGNSLVTSMISIFMKKMSSASSHRLASFIGVPPSMERLIESAQQSPGLKWKEVRSKEPTGREIKCDRLVAILRQKTELSQEELDGLKIAGLSFLVYVKVDDKYFTPDETLVLDAEFERRSREVYYEIFPDALNSEEESTGCKLPNMAMMLLGRLKYPVDLSAAALQAKKWFSCIDVDLSGKLSLDELEKELENIKLTHQEMKFIMEFHIKDKSENGKMSDKDFLDVEEFVKTIVHVLDNSIKALNAADMVTVGHLFHKYDKDGNGEIDLEEFHEMTMDLVKKNYVFSGLENLESLNLNQLLRLRDFAWKGRATFKPEEDDEEDAKGDDGDKAEGDDEKGEEDAKGDDKKDAEARSAADDKKHAETSVEEDWKEKKDNNNEQNKEEDNNKKDEDDNKEEKKYVVSDKDNRKAKEIYDGIKLICETLFKSDKPLNIEVKSLLDSDKGVVFGKMVPFYNKLKFKMQDLAFHDHEHARENQQDSEHTVSLYEISPVMDSASLSVARRGRNGSLTASMKEDGFTIGLNPDAHTALIKVESYEDDLKVILLGHVIQIAFNLDSEGIITAPPLDWDGSLGPHEERMMNRLAFLLKAYTVQAWWWELLEMLRKFILTVGLAALYKGSPEHLGGSLLTIFVFLLMHVLLKPYINSGLNIYQRLALISSFLTAFGALMFMLQTSYAYQNGTKDDGPGKTIVGVIILVCNAAAAGLYPLWRVLVSLSEGKFDWKTMKEHIGSVVTKTCFCRWKCKNHITAPSREMGQAQAPEEITPDSGANGTLGTLQYTSSLEVVQNPMHGSTLLECDDLELPDPAFPFEEDFGVART
jgi:Ca2+-binding EF-hand superfamily protein